MSNKRIVEVETIWGGSQPRPYADHRYEAYITFSVPEGQVTASKFPSRIEEVIPYAQLMVHSWSEFPEFYDSRLEKLEQVSKEPNKWHVIVTSPYID